MMNCRRSCKVSEYFDCRRGESLRGLLYLLGDLARLLAFGGCLSQSARALSFLHCGNNT